MNQTPLVSRRAILALPAFAFLGSLRAAAADIEAPPLLVVDGAVARPGQAFDLTALQALPKTEFTTHTIWTAGASTFTGVALSDLLAAIGGTGATLRLAALNDYAIEMPTSDATPGGPIVAYGRDRKPMPVRDKGPLWIVYPFDDKREYRSETTYSRCVWQLKSLTIVA